MWALDGRVDLPDAGYGCGRVLAPLPDGRVVTCQTDSGDCDAWVRDADTGAPCVRMPGPSTLRGMRVLADGAVVTQHDGGVMRLWTVTSTAATPTPIAPCVGGSRWERVPLRRIAFSAASACDDGRRWAAWASGVRLAVADARTGALRWEREVDDATEVAGARAAAGPHVWVRTMEVVRSHDGARAFAAHAYRCTQLDRAEPSGSGTFGSWIEPYEAVSEVLAMADGRRFATADRAGRVRVWSFSAGACLATIVVGPLWRSVGGGGGAFAAVALGDGRLATWRLPDVYDTSFSGPAHAREIAVWEEGGGEGKGERGGGGGGEGERTWARARTLLAPDSGFCDAVDPWRRLVELPDGRLAGVAAPQTLSHVAWVEPAGSGGARPLAAWELGGAGVVHDVAVLPHGRLLVHTCDGWAVWAGAWARRAHALAARAA